MGSMSPTEFDAFLRDSFGVFQEKAFKELNQGIEYKLNWHHDKMVYEANLVRTGVTKRLLLNAPPRCLKSHVFSVALPAYMIGLNPAKKIICASYSESLALKHANDFRRLVGSDWYKRAFSAVKLIKDAETEICTSAGGFRLTTSVGGTLTGRGGDLLIIDDPMNAAEAASEASLQRVAEWFHSTVHSRLDEPENGSIIIVMQRLHHRDLTGVLL